MTNLTIEALALVDRAGKEWVRHKELLAGVEARVRARVEAEMAEERKQSALKVSLAMQAAIEGGATKAALHRVTTRDFRTFKSFFELADEVAQPADAEIDAVEPGAAAEWSAAWERPDVLRIKLDPMTVSSTQYDRNRPEFWDGTFEVFVRPHDGQVFVDPTGDVSFEVGIAVTEWLRSSENNLAQVVAWIADNPQN